MKKIPEFLKQIEVGSNTIFRGHADSEWKLVPSVGRHFSGDWQEVVEREKTVLEEFKKRSIPYLKNRPTSDIEWLCLMQHHGCATRLLDFTVNPLIALFFATDSSVEADGEVLFAEYNRSYTNVTNDDLFTRTHAFAYHPPHITERIIGQSGCFVYSSKPNRPLTGNRLKRIAIRQKEKSTYRRELNDLGINYSTLFPGIDGVCRVLNDVLVHNLEIDELI